MDLSPNNVHCMKKPRARTVAHFLSPETKPSSLSKEIKDITNYSSNKKSTLLYIPGK